MAELLGLYTGGLFITGALTRGMHLLLRRRVENPMRSVLVTILAGLLCLLGASYNMGPVEASIVYLPSALAWFAFDMYRLARKAKGGS